MSTRTHAARGERILQLLWVQAPLRLARPFSGLAHALSDGQYLLRWPALARSAPPAALLLGLLCGSLHPGEAFTRSPLLTLLLLGVGMAGGQLGVWLVAGYALGDLALHRHGHYGASPVLVYLPLLLSYYLLALGCVGIPLAASAAAGRARGRRLSPRMDAAMAVGVFALTAGVLAYAWAMAVPVLIRPVFTWPGGMPSAADITPLQSGTARIGLAVAAFATVRAILETTSSRDARVQRLAGVVRAGLAQRARRSDRGAGGVVREIAGGVALTVLIAGLVPGWTAAVLTVLFFTGLLHLRNRLRRASPSWLLVLARVPFFVRFGAGLGLGYLLSRPIVAFLWSRTQTLSPVLIAACLSVGLVTLLSIDPDHGPAGGTERPTVRPPRGTALLIAVSAVALSPAMLRADNCSGLSDCFFTIAGLLAVAAALALLLALIIGTGGGAGGLFALAGGGAWGSAGAAAAAMSNVAAAAAAASAAAAAAGAIITMMSSGGTPGNNQAQNRQFNDAVRDAERQLGRRLNRDEIRRVHDEITGQNLGYHEIIETILGIFGG